MVSSKKELSVEVMLVTALLCLTMGVVLSDRPRTMAARYRDECRGSQRPATIVSSSVWAQSFYIGDKIKLMCFACGRPRPKITWYTDGQEIIFRPNMRVTEYRYNQNKIKSYLEIDPATESNAGEFMCRASNRNGYEERIITMTALYPNVQG